MPKQGMQSARQTQLLFCLLLAATPLSDAGAATINAESTLGDFHGGQLFSLTDEQNQFVGGHTWGGADPFDGFRFIVPTGRTAVVSISFSFPGLAAGEKQAWIWDLSSLPAGTGQCVPTSPYACVGIPNQTRLISEIVQSEPGFVSPPDNTFAGLNTVILGNGVYLVNDNFGFDNLGASNLATGRLDYVVSVNLTPVPLPAMAPLLGGILLGMLRYARRS